MKSNKRKLPFPDIKEKKKNEFENISKLIAPKTQNDLAVAKNKIEEIKAWLMSFEGILVVSGPAGCGKHVTLNVLCQQLNIKTIRWASSAFSSSPLPRYLNDQMTPSEEFRNFLRRAYKYPSLLNEKQITVVDNIPHNLSSSDEFIDILENLHSTKKYPIIFVFTQNETTLHAEMFPKSLCLRLNIKHIHLNAVTQNNMMKALRRIINIFNLTLHSKFSLSNNELHSLYSLSQGDLRYASLTLHYVAITSKEKTTSVKKDKEENIKHTYCKDNQLGLFHGIGKILYPKRKKEITETKSGNFEGVLLFNPQNLVDEFSSMSKTFVSFIQENYLKVFSDINNIAKTAEYLASYDTFIYQWKDNILTEEAMNIAIRGTLYYNTKGKKIFLPLTKSKYSYLNTQENIVKIRTEFTDQCYSMDTFHSEILPYLSKLLPHGIQNYSQEEYIYRMGLMDKIDKFHLKPKTKEDSKPDLGLNQSCYHISDDSSDDENN